VRELYAGVAVIRRFTMAAGIETRRLFAKDAVDCRSGDTQ
jgi:hypothetical protein